MFSDLSVLVYVEVIKNKVMLIALIGPLPAGKGNSNLPAQ